MNAHAVGWLLLVALMGGTDGTDRSKSPFQLESPKPATEGSCAEIHCKVQRTVEVQNAHWFWLKNAVWMESERNFNGTCVYSSNNREHPVSPDFANRVTFIGSQHSPWKTTQPQPCSILICNLNKSDSGNYSFRYINKNFPTDKYHSDKVFLQVKDNPCLIKFDKPPAVSENERVTLTCSTLKTCTGYLPQIKDARTSEKLGTTTYSFTAEWEDDGRVFSCHLENHEDKYLVSNVTLSVKYAAKQTKIVSPSNNSYVKEGDSVTLKCLSKGNPQPTFRWLKDNEERMPGAEWNITSITAEDNGIYTCEARNTHGASNDTIHLNVQYAPKVEIRLSNEVTGSSYTLREGERKTPTCYVRKSNPEPVKYAWFKNGYMIRISQIKQLSDAGRYTCKATNSIGTGTSPELNIIFEYEPRKPNIIVFSKYVKVNDPLTLQCETAAYPKAQEFDWDFSVTEQTSYKSPSLTTTEKLSLGAVRKTDQGYYRCRGSNKIGTGQWSEPVQIQVFYPPTIPLLHMPNEVMEGDITTITCIVDSHPLSSVTLKGASISNHEHGRWEWPINDQYRNNTFIYSFSVTWTQGGLYSCLARNSEGAKESSQSQLVVKYAPKCVTVQGLPNLNDVKEGVQLTLQCKAYSHPPLTSVTWMKEIDGKFQVLENFVTNRESKDFILKSVKPSDRGRYKCKGTNIHGTAESQPRIIEVKYAPKNTTITRVRDWKMPNGNRAVMLRCNSRSYPEIKKYSWYKKVEGSREKKVSDSMDYMVISKYPGHYYCVVENEISKSSSLTEEVFLESGLIKVLKITIPCLLIPLFIFAIFWFRHRRNKANGQTTSRTQPRGSCFACMGQQPRTRGRNLGNECVMADTHRSRDDLLPGLYQSPAYRHNPAPDSTTASDTQCVYSTVHLPFGDQGPSAQTQVGHTEDPSVNYASLHFGNKQKKPLTDAVYAVVSKPGENNKGAQERPEIYENIATARHKQASSSSDSDTSEDEGQRCYGQGAQERPECYKKVVTAQHKQASSSSDSDTSEDHVQLSNTKGAQEKPECYKNMATAGHKQATPSSDSDTSEEEVELRYTQVSFTPKPGHHRANRDSSSSEEGTQYSQIRL